MTVGAVTRVSLGGKTRVGFSGFAYFSAELLITITMAVASRAPLLSGKLPTPPELKESDDGSLNWSHCSELGSKISEGSALSPASVGSAAERTRCYSKEQRWLSFVQDLAHQIPVNSWRLRIPNKKTFSFSYINARKYAPKTLTLCRLY